jgi:hypothetical protein
MHMHACTFMNAQETLGHEYCYDQHAPNSAYKHISVRVCAVHEYCGHPHLYMDISAADHAHEFLLSANTQTAIRSALHYPRVADIAGANMRRP